MGRALCNQLAAAQNEPAVRGLLVNVIANGERANNVGQPTAAPAIGNAVFNALGGRVRVPPITAEAKKAQMKGLRRHGDNSGPPEHCSGGRAFSNLIQIASNLCSEPRFVKLVGLASSTC